MTSTMVLLLIFLLGCVCGLRSMTGPAVVCWGAHLGWLKLLGSKLGFLHNPVSLAIFTVLALGELVADKLPAVPARTTPGPLMVRFFSGALCGGALGISSATNWIVCALVGGVGAIAGSFAGYRARRWLTAGKGLPDIVVALLEDAVAVGGGFLIVSRF